MQFLYMGFTQREDVRCYRFQGILPGESPARPRRKINLQLSAEMSMLAEYQIRFQDGPALCLRILNEALGQAEGAAVRFASYAITRKDMSAFAEAKQLAERAKAAGRKPRPPSRPSSASRWKGPRAQ